MRWRASADGGWTRRLSHVHSRDHGHTTLAVAPPLMGVDRSFVTVEEVDRVVPRRAIPGRSAEGMKIDDDTLLTRRQPVGRAAELYSLVHERGDLYVRRRHRGETKMGVIRALHGVADDLKWEQTMVRGTWWLSTNETLLPRHLPN